MINLKRGQDSPSLYNEFEKEFKSSLKSMFYEV
jgi:hypothetical protein